MLKKLRLRIIATVLAMATVVFVVAFAILCTTVWDTSYATFSQELEEAVKRGPAVSVGFSIGGWDDAAQDTETGGAENGGPGRADPLKEARGSFTPIAIITYDPAQGTILQYNADYAQMAQSVRAEAIKRTLAQDSGTGIYADLGLFWCIHCDMDGQFVIAFADANAFLSSMRATVRGIAVVFGLALGAVAVVSVLLAHLITRPVKRAWDQQSQFIADASHELKTPLTVVLADADIIAAHPQTQVGEQMKWVDGIKDEAQRMRGLVEEMLFLARNDEAGRDKAARGTAETMSLSSVVQEACLAFDAVAFEAGVTLEEDVEENIELKADKTQVERLVKSLIDNAVKYAGIQGRVRVALKGKKKGRATFSVNNTGPVIAPEDLPRVFDRFWKSDASRTRGTTASYGLGLAIAKNIAEAQGGRISVASNEKDGTTFTVEF